MLNPAAVAVALRNLGEYEQVTMTAVTQERSLLLPLDGSIEAFVSEVAWDKTVQLSASRKAGDKVVVVVKTLAG